MGFKTLQINIFIKSCTYFGLILKEQQQFSSQVLIKVIANKIHLIQIPGAEDEEESANGDLQEDTAGDANDGGGFFRGGGDDDDDFVEDGPARNFQARNIPFPGDGQDAGAVPANGDKKPPKKIKKKTVPKIYFGTR